MRCKCCICRVRLVPTTDVPVQAVESFFRQSCGIPLLSYSHMGLPYRLTLLWTTRGAYVYHFFISWPCCDFSRRARTSTVLRTQLTNIKLPIVKSRTNAASRTRFSQPGCTHAEKAFAYHDVSRTEQASILLFLGCYGGISFLNLIIISVSTPSPQPTGARVLLSIRVRPWKQTNNLIRMQATSDRTTNTDFIASRSNNASTFQKNVAV